MSYFMYIIENREGDPAHKQQNDTKKKKKKISHKGKSNKNRINENCIHKVM